MTFTDQAIQPIFNPIHYAQWRVKGFDVLFLLSERLLTEIRKLSCLENWYEDPVAVAIYLERVHVCFISVQKYYEAFGILPQVGDRLYNEDTGMIVQDRSIDGTLMTITFTLSS